MGLDMYLKAERYIWRSDEQLARDIAKACNVYPEFRARSVSVEAAYWRKANHIHQWFVENVQNGADDCGEYDVSREQLGELLALVRTVKANPVMAPETLPTQGGFFFGSTEYDSSYMEDLEDTEDQITKALTLSKEWDFKYHSSW